MSLEPRNPNTLPSMMERRVGDLQVVNLTLGDLKRLLGLEWAKEADLLLFARQCTRYDLDPFAGEIFMIPFKDKESGEKKPSIVTSEKVFASRGMDRLIQLGYRLQKIRNWVEGDKGRFQIWVKGETEPLVDVSVTAGEKSTGRGLWVIESKKAVMLKKAARLDGWRLLLACPFYHPQELPQISEAEEKQAMDFFGEREEKELGPGPLNVVEEPPEAPTVSDEELAEAAAAREALQKHAQASAEEKKPTPKRRPMIKEKATPAPAAQQEKPPAPAPALIPSNGTQPAPPPPKASPYHCVRCGHMLPEERVKFFATPIGQKIKQKCNGMMFCEICTAEDMEAQSAS